jgi:ACR3 family arsenite transporter
VSATAATIGLTPGIGFFERWLTAWVALCIVTGIALGQWLPGPVKAMGELEIARVNLPVGALIWVMIVPMLIRVDFGALRQVTEHWRGLASPSSSTGRSSRSRWRSSPGSSSAAPSRNGCRPRLDSYVAGLILLAAAPAPRWCSSGASSRAAIPISRCRGWRSTISSWSCFAPIVGLL